MPALSDRIPYQALADRPKLRLPGGARLAVWVIVNVEEWRIGYAMPRTVLPPPMGQPLVPDVPNWSWHEYGMRAGFWRQHAALTSRGIPVTLAINGSVCRSYPRVAAAARQAGWESPGRTETEETLDLLAEHGIDHVADWVIDDLPQAIDDALGPKVNEGFACITHSTGGPVVRLWMKLYHEKNLSACPMKHLVMLAPANHGSTLAQLGKGVLGRLKSMAESIEPGVRVEPAREGRARQRKRELARGSERDGTVEEVRDDGLDPALPAQAVNGAAGDIRDQYRGIDQGSYPSNRTFAIGISTTF